MKWVCLNDGAQSESSLKEPLAAQLGRTIEVIQCIGVSKIDAERMVGDMILLHVLNHEANVMNYATTISNIM